MRVLLLNKDSEDGWYQSRERWMHSALSMAEVAPEPVKAEITVV